MSTPPAVDLLGLKLKSIKADLLAQTVTLTFTADLDDQLADARPHLQHFHTFADPLDLTITPQHTQLPIQTFGPTKGDPFA